MQASKLAVVAAVAAAGTSSETDETDSAAPGPQRAASSAPPPSDEDPVPREVSGVIELFASQLARVAFPDIDAASLRRQAEELRAEAAEVARARAALDAAIAGLVARRAALGDTAARAVAYARIYSEAHPDQVALATAIAALSEPRPAAVAAPSATGKRRGRPPKRSAELFDAPGAPGAPGSPGSSGTAAGADPA